MKPLPRLLLASASPRRSALLASLGLPFRVEVSEAREVAPGHLVPREVCLANATAKAMAVARRHPGALVIGADTEVTLGLRVFGKPADLREAAAFLRALAGRTHEVVTAVCLVCRERGVLRSFSETTRVTFHPLSDRQIRAYLARVNPLDKAGAYAVQECGEWIVESIEGSLTNVVGLPLGRLREVLAGMGAFPRVGKGVEAPRPAVERRRTRRRVRRRAARR